MPQFDPAFFQSEIIWSLISFALFFFLLNRLVLPRASRILRKRIELIHAEIETARKEREQALQLQQSYEQRLAQAEEEAKRFFAEEERKFRDKQQKLLNQFHSEMDKRKRDFYEDLAVANQMALRKLRREVAEYVVAATEKLIALHVSREEAQALIDRALDELEERRRERA